MTKFEIASCRLKLNKFGSDIPKLVTPAEVKLLRSAHQVNAGGDPISELTIVGTVTRSQSEERNRLQGEYGNLKVRHNNNDVNVLEATFPGMDSDLPTTFASIGHKDLPKKNHKVESYDPEPSNPEGTDVIAGIEEGDGGIEPIEPETPAPAPKPAAPSAKK